MAVRPSSLSIAKHCALSPVLSERFPSVSDATERGSLVDAQVTAWVKDGTAPADRDAIACVQWLAETFDPTEWELKGQVALPPAVEGAAPGTADLVAYGCDGDVVVVDYKKREAWDAGRIPAPADNDQLHAYALAASDHGSYDVCLLLFGNGRVEPIWARGFTPANTGPIVERIRATCTPTEGEPRGTSGAHCGMCWSRIHCHHWALRAWRGITEPVLPTRENAEEAMLRVVAMEERAKLEREILKHIADPDVGGAPFRVGEREFGRVMMPGKMSVDVDALEAAGLYERFSKVGNPYPQYRLGKPRGGVK